MRTIPPNLLLYSDNPKVEALKRRNIFIYSIFPIYYFSLQHSDMIDEMRAECVELSITACEKFAANYEVGVTDKE